MIKGTEVILLDYDIPLTVEYTIDLKGLKINQASINGQIIKLDRDAKSDLLEDLEIVLADVTEIED